jgi:hypothetical protein
MIDLAQLQMALQRSILAGKGAPMDAIVDPSVDVATRMDIYATAYRLRLTEALAANFPRLQNLLGKDRFTDAANDYLDRYPSTNVSVRWFGHRLAEFLRDSPAFAPMPWLAELASWEWEIAAAFDSADATPIGLQALNMAAGDWPQLRFRLHPSVRLLSLHTNAVSLSREPNEERERPSSATKIGNAPQAYVIWRQGLDVRFREQSADEARALTSLSEGETFEAMCATLCDWWEEAEVPARAASLLKTWIVEGLIACVE